MAEVQDTPTMTDDAEALVALSVENLQGRSRRSRQEASQILARLAKDDPESVADHADALIAALEVHEAQTRWQCLEALADIARVAPESILEGFDGAEAALFEEGSPSMRVAAFRFMVCYSMVSPERSAEAWPIMAEALQCYHGDPEYRDMLICLRDLVGADLDANVRANLLSRMAFDSKQGRGLVRAYATDIMGRFEEAASRG